MVVDALIAAAWMLADERSASAMAVLDRLGRRSGHVPALFWFEVRNLLLKAERRGRCTIAQTSEFMSRLRELPLFNAESPADAPILALARARNLTAYDASYLALALANGWPLATGDRKLAEAARLEGVALLGPFA